MKSFQFKDLMVNVSPAGEGAALCGVGTFCTACTWGRSWCNAGATHCGTNSVTVTQLQAQVAAPVRGAFGCGFGGYTCNYGTYCGFSIGPCGYTCDYGNTHPTRPFLEEQAAVAAPAAQAGVGAGAGAAFCAFFTCFNFTCGFTPRCRIFTCGECTVTVIPCAFTCGVTDPGPLFPQGDPQGVVSQLAAVKAQLQQELAAIETQEKAVAEALKPQTAADIEELQGKLRDAIAELDKQKQELHKKAEKPSKK